MKWATPKIVVYNFFAMLFQNMLLKMPGINSKNAYMIMNKVESLAELVTLSQDQLIKLLESERNGQALYKFLHSDHKTAQATVTSKSTSSGFYTKKRAFQGSKNNPTKGAKRKK